MKNIQEILLKCNGKGKLKLGDEEIDIDVISVNSKINKLCDYRDCTGTPHDGKRYIMTRIEVSVIDDEFDD